MNKIDADRLIQRLKDVTKNDSRTAVSLVMNKVFIPIVKEMMDEKEKPMKPAECENIYPLQCRCPYCGFLICINR